MPRKYKRGDTIEVPMADGTVERGVAQDNGEALWGNVYYRVWLPVAQRYTDFPVKEDE